MTGCDVQIWEILLMKKTSLYSSKFQKEFHDRLDNFAKSPSAALKLHPRPVKLTFALFTAVE
jgi:hypothetical protein